MGDLRVKRQRKDRSFEMGLGGGGVPVGVKAQGLQLLEESASTMLQGQVQVLHHIKHITFPMVVKHLQTRKHSRLTGGRVAVYTYVCVCVCTHFRFCVGTNKTDVQGNYCSHTHTPCCRVH